MDLSYREQLLTYLHDAADDSFDKAEKRARELGLGSFGLWRAPEIPTASTTNQAALRGHKECTAHGNGCPYALMALSSPATSLVKTVAMCRRHNQMMYGMEKFTDISEENFEKKSSRPNA